MAEICIEMKLGFARVRARAKRERQAAIRTEVVELGRGRSDGAVAVADVRDPRGRDRNITILSEHRIARDHDYLSEDADQRKGELR